MPRLTVSSVELAGGRCLVLHGERAGDALKLVGPGGAEVDLPIAGHGRRAKASIDAEALAPGAWRVEGASLAEGASAGPPYVLPKRRVRLQAAAGGLELEVSAVGPHAEALRLRLDGTILSLELSEPGTVVARSRGEEVAGDGSRLDLALLAGRGGAWRLWLSTPDGSRLPIARRGDGVPGKRRVAALPGGLRFTDEDQLAFEEADALPAPPAARVGWSRRLLGGPAVLVNAVALALLRRLPPSSPAGGRESRVRLVLANAYGMGGTIHATMDLAGELADRRPVEVISVRRHRARPFFEPPEGVGVAVLDDRTAGRGLLTRIPSLLVHPLDDAYAWSSLLTDVRLVRRLRAAHGDIVVTTRPAYGLIAAAAAPPDATVVSQEHMHLGAHPPRLARAVRRAYRRVGAVTVLTEADRVAYAVALGGSGTRVERLPGVRVPPGAPVSTTERTVVVAAGRLAPQKGFDLLVRAFGPVAARHPDWQLRIYGGGPDRDALRQLIVAEGLHDHVYLMGSTRDLAAVLADAGMFVLSSRYEGFGMVVVEAMAAGLPVVSFDCPHGPGETITHERDGLLVPAGDVEGLSAGIETLVGDPARRARMGAAALEASRAFAPQAMAERWEELLAELTG